MATVQIKTDTLYVTPSEEYFFTPDGVGRVWFSSYDEAVEQTGLPGVVVVEWRDRDERAYYQNN